MTVICVSDIHLSDTDSDTSEAFFDFLAQLPTLGATALYILGDLFQYWLGDDILMPIARETATRLSHLSKQGIPCYFLAGNRDFLLGNQYATEAALTLLPDETILTYDQHRYLLTHGDQFCTKDIAYQRYRCFIRHPWVKSWELKLPVRIRQVLADLLRQQSQRAYQKRGAAIRMDCTAESMGKALSISQCNTLIHGHTHAHRLDTISFSGTIYERYVLGDWQHYPGSYVKIDQDGATLCRYFAAPSPMVETHLGS